MKRFASRLSKNVGWLLRFLLLLFPVSLGAASESAIEGISASRPFFNPSLGQAVRISFALRREGVLSVQVLDRDGFVVRHLARAASTKRGTTSLSWDGRDGRGTVVPDEAYSLKIDLVATAGRYTYFPANRPPEQLRVETKYYDRRSAVLSYHLPKPARVHLQAGTATTDAAKKTTRGPVLKTIVNREPRPAGAVIENWNGMDESGTTYVPDRPHFVIAVAATSLPENSIITHGNRATSFLTWAEQRKGTSLITLVSVDHRHHQGLTTLDDVAPPLEAKVQNASWSSRTRSWTPKEKAIKVHLRLTGPSASSFARHPSTLLVYLDEYLVREVARPKGGMTLQIPIRGTKQGRHLLAFNWASPYGPVAVQTIPFHIGGEPRVRLARRSR